jgi:hypothetical protein
MPFLAPAGELARAARIRGVPFPHVALDAGSLLTSDAVDDLLASFPDELLDLSQRAGGSDKTFRTSTVTMHLRGDWKVLPDRLPGCWAGLLRYLASDRYTSELASLLRIPPGPVELELRLTSYPRGGWMSRHTDRPDKLFSHNIYLCPGWQPEWGGELRLYDSATSAPGAVFLPGAGTSVAFARSDRSWHEVMPVSEQAPRPRRAVLVHGYRPAAVAREERTAGDG